MNAFLGILLFFVSLALIGLILIQRGRGGGLAGAFGGMGGQSAFGTKAGDLFTRITIGAAFVWILLCAITVKLAGNGDDQLDQSLGSGLPPTSGLDTSASGAPLEPAAPGTAPAAAVPTGAVPAGGAASPAAAPDSAAVSPAAAPDSAAVAPSAPTAPVQP